MLNLKSNFVSGSCDGRYSLQYLLSHHGLINSKLLYRKRCSFSAFRRRMMRVYCESTTKEMQIRKCSPFLESVLLSGNDVLPYTQWNAVPDIWRTSAEKYGDRVALVDPYHDPPMNLTYKQLEQEIKNFSEGLRVVGVKPEEKVALFADNSCRWLIADQGIMATGAINVVRGSRSSAEELWLIYNHSDSVALVVDNPEMYNRLTETFGSQATVKFIVLLWGEKSSITRELEGLPIYCYREIIDLGHESHMGLLSQAASKCILIVHGKMVCLLTSDGCSIPELSKTSISYMLITHSGKIREEKGSSIPGHKISKL